ncbi:MAG: ribosome maturation factor RimM [Pseudomonadota bacterium]
MSDGARVCLGAFAGAHGVRGEARIKSFTADPKDIVAYGPLSSEDGARTFSLKFIRMLKGDVALVGAPEIVSREDAESLKGVRLYADRDRLPAPEEDEFYFCDLVGLKAVDETGAPAGRISAVHNFGAGDLIELAQIPGVNGVRVIQFTKANFPQIALTDRTVTVRRAALDLDATANPSASAVFVEAAMRSEDA